MSPLRRLRRGAGRVARTIRYGWGASLDMSRSSTDVLYPEYDAYDRQPRRFGLIVALTMLAVAGVLGVYLALAHGLGTLLLGSFTSKPDSGNPPVPATRPTGSPSPTVARAGQPAPAPTVTVTAVIGGGSATSTATVTATPTRTKKHGHAAGTPTPPAPPASPPPASTPPAPEGSSPPPPPPPSPSQSPEGP